MLSLFTTVLGLAEAVLSYLTIKEKDKYISELKEIKEAYYAEWNKPEEMRDDAVLDRLCFRLRITTDSLTAQLRLANA
jgi:hypothetical protein